MDSLRFDFNNMLDFNVGRENGVTEEELVAMLPAVKKGHAHLRELIEDPRNRVELGLEWTELPFQGKNVVTKINELGDKIAATCEDVIFLGIGGSYLGLKAAQDALRPPYYNEFGSLRPGRPRIYFAGNNLDPLTLSTLLQQLDPGKTFVVVISKSGETTETRAAFEVVKKWLREKRGSTYGHQILAITDPESGTLREMVEEEQKKDKLSFRHLPLLKGVGGRYSELNMGLLHLSIIGVNVEEVLAGAKAMCQRCSSGSLDQNPAYLYATLQTVLYREKNKSIAIVMPFSETLKSTADWYAQLLAESLGKKYAREVVVSPQEPEAWKRDKSSIVHAGRTPVPCRGTNDLHSIHQNNTEGENNKTITFLRVQRFGEDLNIPRTGDFLSGKSYSDLLTLAEEATEWALVREKRPNCTIIMPEISPSTWGQLLFFFEMATAFEGELLNVNAFDQPGVEGYKNYMYYKLGKPGISEAVKKEIVSHPLRKKDKFVLAFDKSKNPDRKKGGRDEQ